MPKERRDRSLSFDRSRLSPYPYRSSSTSLIEENSEINREWENIRCPVCMEHPHNAILLICSSHDKGCHPFMCDTSYRHSNCFDQFQKSFAEASDVSQTPDDVPNSASPLATTASPLAVSDLESAHSPDELLIVDDVLIESTVKPKLVCPLCRGLITGWTVMESARRFMNSKSRTCACETCDFSGSYHDLRKHARLVHPLVRPTDADPERQRNWRRLERQRDLGDLISTLHSIGEDMADGRTLTVDDDGWLTIFFLVRFTRAPSTSTAHSQLAVRRTRPSRRLWGETTDGTVDSREGDVQSSYTGRILPRRYVRRRLHNQDNIAHDSRNNEIESSGSGQSSPRFYVRRRLHNQESVAHDSRTAVESPESGQSFPRLYVRRRRHNQASVRESGEESSDSG